MLVLLPAFAALFLNDVVAGQVKDPNFRVIALAEHGGIHKPFVDAAKTWLGKLAGENNFTVDYIEDTEKIDDAFLAKYALFIQLNYPPYNWTDRAKAAFINYIEQGKGGCRTRQSLSPTQEGRCGKCRTSIFRAPDPVGLSIGG